jgi:hypothetical protein
LYGFFLVFVCCALPPFVQLKKWPIYFLTAGVKIKITLLCHYFFPI